MPDLRETWRRQPAPVDSRAAPTEPSAPTPAPAQSSPVIAPPWADPHAVPPGQLAGFWMRIFAALADSILLAILGWLIARQEYPWLIQIGQYGRLIGLGITLVYFGVMNSALGGGATFGKYIFGIRVVGRDGERISFERALVRALVYTVPFYLNGIDYSFLPLDRTGFIGLGAVDGAIVLGGMGAIVYLYIANKRTRQSLHDLVAGTFVVNARAVHAPVHGRIYPAHLVITVLWFALFLGGIPLGARYIASSPWGQMLNQNLETTKKIQNAVNAIPTVGETSVVMSQSFVAPFTGFVLPDFVTVSVRLKEIPSEPGRVANAVAQRVLEVSPDLDGHQRLTVVVRYGYDIGIKQDWRAFIFSGTPADWRSKFLHDESGHET